MATKIAESLFDAINIIASKKVSDLPYDKTLICTIVDNSNAEKGEYTVTDGVSEFLAYTEVTDYRNNAKVYVTIPNGDMLNKKYIASLYVADESNNFETYISPMDNFVDLTDDITNG